MRRTPSVADRLIAACAAFVAVLVLAMLAAPGTAAAAASCSASVTNGSFSPLDTLNATTANTTATLTFSCTGLTPGLPVTLCPSLDAGTGGSDGAGGRRLAGPGGANVAFQIYQDSGRSQTWGSSTLLGFGATPTITMTPDATGKATKTQTLYAKVTFSSSTPQGSYTTSFDNQNFFWGLNLLSCAGITIGYAIPPPSFTFTANVDPSCTLSAGTLAFGNVGVLTQPVTGQNSLSVRCTANTAWSVGLDNGQNGTGPTARKMSLNAGRITYGIYKDSDRTQPWGLAAQGASAVNAGTGTGSTQTLTGYGKAPAQSTPAPGLYADTVIATITY